MTNCSLIQIFHPPPRLFNPLPPHGWTCEGTCHSSESPYVSMSDTHSLNSTVNSRSKS